ncbi:GNAT family N-acetyltransferase [Streptomyces sp. NBC_01601]|uniref:GNAT family N-acetyltransferase n=1 Tax=Streptomyces sp. NBC_01601 TaxID=2975892 RepID=UPI002E2C0618|nr:GNAT family N-acetyltransferase [Streptomyces sp. NBC_01601]
MLTVGAVPRVLPKQAASTTAQFITRRAHLGDLEAVNALHHRCTLDTRYARYATGRSGLTRTEWSRWVHPAAGSTWLTAPAHDPATPVALTHLLKTDTPDTYEFAVLIEDRWQNKGLGSRLAAQALVEATAQDCHVLTATIGATNARATAIMRRLRIPVPVPAGGVIGISIRLSERS